jgi:hypothetical protein
MVAILLIIEMSSLLSFCFDNIERKRMTLYSMANFGVLVGVEPQFGSNLGSPSESQPLLGNVNTDEEVSTVGNLEDGGHSVFQKIRRGFYALSKYFGEAGQWLVPSEVSVERVGTYGYV